MASALLVVHALAAPAPSGADLTTAPAPAGISGEVVVSAPPGGSAVVYTVGLRGNGPKVRLTGLNLLISPLGEPLRAGLRQADFVQLRLIESADAVLGNGDDVLLNTVPASAIDVAGGITAVGDNGHAALLGTTPPPADRFRFYFVVADMAPGAATGHAFRLGAATRHITTSAPSTLGSAVTASNARRVVINRLVPVPGFAPSSLGYGSVRVGTTSTADIAVTNRGAVALSVTRIASSDPQFAPDVSRFTVAPGGVQVVHVRFRPTAEGPVAADLTFTHNDTLPSITTTVALAGTGVSPRISVAPAALSFGEVLLNTPSALTVAVANTGSAPLNVTNVTSSSGRFVPDLTAFAVAPGASRDLRVTFTPNATGARTATLSIVHDDRLRGSPSTVALSGTGINPVIGVSPAALAFGTVAVGGTGSLPLTVRNTGTTSLAVSAIASSHPRFSADRVSLTVARGASQTVWVAFAPTSGGGQTGVLSLVHNAAGSPTTVPLSGTGASPAILVTPTSLDFGEVAVGGHTGLSVTVSNPGSAALTVSQVAASDPQFAADVSSFSLAAGAQRAVAVTFTPAAGGPQSGQLSLIHNGSGSPAVVLLGGYGTSPSLALSPTSLHFGSVRTGSSSALPLTVRNSGTATLAIISVTASDSRLAVDGSGFALLPGDSRDLEVRFAPTSAGPFSASLSIAHSAAGSPASVPVDGEGTAPTLTVAPAALSFGEVAVGGLSSLSLTVSNPGTATLVVTNVAISDTQYRADVTSFSVAPGGHQEVNVAFAPTAAGACSATLSVAHNAAGSPALIPVSGVGTSPEIRLSPSRVEYGSVLVGSSYAIELTVANPGTRALEVTNLTSTDGQFVPVRTSFTVPAGGSQQVGVTFAPADTGAQSAVLTITHNAPGSPSLVVAVGTGAHPSLLLTPPSLRFGNVTLGNSATVPVVLTNTGRAAVRVTDISSSDPQFGPDVSECTLEPGASQSLAVTFTASTLGSKSGTLFITHDGPGGLLQVPLSGDATVAVSVSAVDFGRLQLSASESLPVPVRNPSTAPVTITRVVSSDPQFVPDLTNFTIPPGETRTIRVAFTPTAPGLQTATLSITHNPTITLTLTGVGAGTLASSPASPGQRRRLEVPFGGEGILVAAISLAGLLWQRCRGRRRA